MYRSEDSIESNESNNNDSFFNNDDRLDSRTSATTKSAANFFDYEEDDDNNNDDVPLNQFNNQSKNNQSSTTTTTTSTNEQLNNNISLENNKLKNLETSENINYGYDINKKINELIEEELNSIISNTNSSSPSSCSSTTKSILSTRQAVEKIFSGNHNNINLNLFKGKEQKLELLDYALLTGDKYTITKIILYLEQTLKPSIFFYEIVRRPVIADHYLLYLKNLEQFDQQLNVLNRMGRLEDAAFQMYSRASKSSAEPQQQLKLLEKSLLNFQIGTPELLQWQLFIKEHITLLERQLPIETDDCRRSEEAMKLQQQQQQQSSETTNPMKIPLLEDNQLFVIYPRINLVGLSLMETLRYCCLYHYQLPDNNFASPFHLKKIFHISDRQFLWMALQSLAKTNRWNEIDNLFEYKSWLGSRKIRNILPITDIIEVLYKNSSPPEMLEKYLDLVDDSERKLQLAKEYHMNKYAADILIKLRDRKRLSELRSLIKTKFEMDYVQRYIDNALITSTIKWKN